VTKDHFLQQLYAGQAGAFDQLYHQYAQTIYRLGWSMLRQQQAAEDVVQETFLRAYKARHRFDPAKASFGTWLYQIALNYCRSELRRSQRRKIRLTISNLDQTTTEETNLPAATLGPEGQILHTEYQRSLWVAVERLSPRLREVIILHYYLELPAGDIAQMLNCPTGTVYSRLHNARRRLAKLLAKQGITTADIFEVHNVS